MNKLAGIIWIVLISSGCGAYKGNTTLTKVKENIQRQETLKPSGPYIVGTHKVDLFDIYRNQ